MTSPFQWIIDNAESISVNRKKMVAMTTARDGTTRAVSRGAIPKRFTVKLPDGMRWTDVKSLIEATEAADKVTIDMIEFSNPGQAWWYNRTTIPSNAESYNVRIVEFPEWTLFARNQVSWSGPFVFVEVF